MQGRGPCTATCTCPDGCAVRQVLDGAPVPPEAPPLTVSISSIGSLFLSLCRLPRRGQLYSLVLRALIIALRPDPRLNDPAEWRARHDPGDPRQSCPQFVRLHARHIFCCNRDPVGSLRDLATVTRVQIASLPNGRSPPWPGRRSATDLEVEVRSILNGMLIRHNCEEPFEAAAVMVEPPPGAAG